MVRECYGNCKHIGLIQHANLIGIDWCFLTDDSVDGWEHCNS